MISCKYKCEDKQFPIRVRLSIGEAKLTKLAALELKRKLDEAIFDMEDYEATSNKKGGAE